MKVDHRAEEADIYYLEHLKVDISEWWTKQGGSVDELVNPGTSKAQILKFQKLIGKELEDLFRHFLLRINGQPVMATPLMGEYRLMSLGEISALWESWKNKNDAGAFLDRVPKTDKRIRKRWWHPDWIPIAHNKTGDFMCLDLNPGPAGERGQIIRVNLHDPIRSCEGYFLQWLEFSLHDRNQYLIRYFWDNMKLWLQDHNPSALHGLNPPLPNNQLERLEALIGHKLPESYRAFLQIHNGQSRRTPPLMMDMWLLGAEGVEGYWRNLKKEYDRGSFHENGKLMSSLPEPVGKIKPEWWNPAWIPIANNPDGSWLCLDLSPDQDGEVGQIIYVDINLPEREFVSNDIGYLLKSYLERLYNEAFQYDPNEMMYLPTL